MICRRSRNLIVNGVLSSKLLPRMASNHTVDAALRPMEDFTRRLIDANAAGDSNYKHRDPSRLWSAVSEPAVSQRRPVPSMEKAQFLAQNQTLQSIDVDPFKSGSPQDDIRPGAFVELRRNRVITHGVILQKQVIESRMHSYTLTYTGEIWPHLLNDITYVIPNFVAQDIMDRVGPSFEAQNTSETAARLQVVEQVRTYTRQFERHFNSMGKDVIMLYDQVRHPDSDRWVDITTPEATRYLDVRKPPPILTLFAVHTHMMSRPLYFVADPHNHRTTHRFSIRPLSHVQVILQVNGWVRNRDPVFHSFLRKARGVIKQARHIRNTHWDGPPARASGQFPTWTYEDLTFIRYIQNALRTTRTTQDDPYDHALPTIVKNLGFYDDQIVGPGAARSILCELGVITPWEDLVARTPELRLDIASSSESREAQAVSELVDHGLHSPASPLPSITRRKLKDVHLEGSTDLYQQDPHKAMRHDFGGMPVYIIDDVGAEELDDGLSVEPVAGEPGNSWVHVHIADPTRVIPPGHVLDLRAREKGVTVYSAHRTWPMLPPALTQPLFSLGSKPEGEPQEVLTFSMKVSDNGELLEYRVRPGLVRNLRIILYDQVDRLLGIKHSYKTYPIPGTPQPTIPPGFIPESSRSDLERLRYIAGRLHDRAYAKHAAVTFALPRSQVRFPPSLPTNPLLPPSPIIWKGYPTTIFEVENSEESEKSFRRVVAQCMQLACRAASLFCRDKGLPALRRTSKPLQAPTEEAMAEIVSQRSPLGYVDPFEFLKYNIYAPAGEPTLLPLEHWGLAIPQGEGYCRVTSPLRRYADLLMHWQIKHELLPVSARTAKGALFPEEYLRSVMHKLYDREKLTNNVENMYSKTWSYSYLGRYLEDGRRKHGPDYNALPGLFGRTLGFVGFDTFNLTGQVPVVVMNLGVHGILTGIDPKLDAPIGSTYPVKITEVKSGLPPTLTLGLA